MAKRTYRSAAGKVVDMEALKLKQEETLAVGNMRVNARGDELTPDGRVIKSKAQSVQSNYYDLHTMVPDESAIPESSASINEPISNKPQPDVTIEEQLTPTQKQSPFVEDISINQNTAPEQEKPPAVELKPQREQKRSISGVKRI